MSTKPTKAKKARRRYVAACRLDGKGNGTWCIYDSLRDKDIGMSRTLARRVAKLLDDGGGE